MVPLSVTTKTIGSNHDSNIVLATFEMSAFKNNPFDATIRQIQLQITKTIVFANYCILRTSEAQVLTEKKLKMYAETPWKFNNYLEKASLTNLLRLITTNVRKF